MTTVKNLKELEKLLNKKINNAMKNEVNKVARNTLKEHIVEDVYEEYTPSTSPQGYKRTGGLLQDRNIESHVDENNTLTVRSIREEDGRDIAKVIETGTGYDWEDSRIYEMQPYPRPFHKEATIELKKGKAKKALEDGLRKQGLNIK